MPSGSLSECVFEFCFPPSLLPSCVCHSTVCFTIVLWVFSWYHLQTPPFATFTSGAQLRPMRLIEYAVFQPWSCRLGLSTYFVFSPVVTTAALIFSTWSCASLTSLSLSVCRVQYLPLVSIHGTQTMIYPAPCQTSGSTLLFGATKKFGEPIPAHVVCVWVLIFLLLWHVHKHVILSGCRCCSHSCCFLLTDVCGNAHRGWIFKLLWHH